MTEKFEYTTESLKELTGFYIMAVYRINLEIERNGLDYDEVWDMFNQEYDSITENLRRETADNGTNSFWAWKRIPRV